MVPDRDGDRQVHLPHKVCQRGLLFKFKREWHSVAKYVAESVHELAYVGSKLMNRPYKG